MEEAQLLLMTILEYQWRKSDNNSHDFDRMLEERQD